MQKAWQPTPVSLAGVSRGQRSLAGYSPCGGKELDVIERLSTARHIYNVDFPGSSAGKESACNAGDPSSIPGLGTSTGEGIGYPFQFSWASLVAEMVKNPPAMRETWVRSLGWEDPLEEGMATHSSIIAWRIPMVREARRATVQGVAKSRTRLSN